MKLAVLVFMDHSARLCHRRGG